MSGDSLFSLMKKTSLMQTVQWNMTAGCSSGARALPSPEVSCKEAQGSAELELVCRRDLQSQLNASGRCPSRGRGHKTADVFVRAFSFLFSLVVELK